MKALLFFLVILVVVACGDDTKQSPEPGGGVDTTFVLEAGANDRIENVVLQADGKILVAGNFTSFNGLSRQRIARLNVDGSVDTNFDPGTGADAPVYMVLVQKDGKIVIGGNFTTYNGTGRSRIARLHADGSLDTTFDPGSGANAWVVTGVIDTNDNIIIAGYLTDYNGTARQRVARLNPDGSLDMSFDTAVGANDIIRSLSLQTDGKILAGGWFTQYKGVAKSRVMRLDPNGSLDITFNAGANINGYVNKVLAMPDGRIILAGDFTNFAGSGINRIIRLEADGSLDATFNPGDGPDNRAWTVSVQGDGKLIVSGLFTAFDGRVRGRIARLHANGGLDEMFDPGIGANDWIVAVPIQADGMILAGGYFTNFNGVEHNRLVRLKP